MSFGSPPICRITPDLPAYNPTEPAAFYGDVFGLTLRMDMGWIGHRSARNLYRGG